VQALTIPIFTAAAPVDAPRGLLSKWRRRPTSATGQDGCEPDAFADHVAVYLERTAADRQVETTPEPGPEPAFEPWPEPAFEAPSEPAFELMAAPAFDTAPEQPLEPPFERTCAPELEPAFDFELEVQPAPEPEPEPAPEVLVAKCLALAARAADLRELVSRVRPLPIPAVDTWRPEPRLRELLATMADRRYRPVLALGPAEIAVVAEEEPAWAAVALDDLYEPAPPAPMPVETPLPEEDVWVLEPIAGMDALIQANRPAQPAPEPKPTQTRKIRARTPRPMQDEWGFFDPEQCGFAALLAKLDEITEDDDADDPGPDTTVRLIAY
jgi:hypothetical protein